MPGIDIPGPLTLRIMLLVVSSINSTRTWVTPPREPIQSHPNQQQFFPDPTHSQIVPRSIFIPLPSLPPIISSSNWQIQNIPVRPKTRVTFTSLTGTLEESIFAICSSQSAIIPPSFSHLQNRVHEIEIRG